MENHTITARSATPEPEKYLPSLRRSAASLLHSEDEAQAVRAQIEAVSEPATPDQIAAEAMVIIAQHFIGSQPQYVRERTAGLWIEHLAPFPLWAIRAAISWWVGPDNPKRDRRAQPGDIAERARVETEVIRAAEAKIGFWERYRGAYPRHLTAQPGRPAA